MNKSPEKQLEHIIRRMQTDTAFDAPADAIIYAKNLFRTRAMAPTRSIFERVVATLKIDLAPGRAAFGERSAGEGQARQMLFDTGDNAVDLRVTATDKGFDIRGQVLGTGFANADVRVAIGRNAHKAKTTETSEFSLSGVPAGEYSVAIQGDEVELYIEPLILK